jgi:hypothetical protein
MTLDL